jgi:hypothetical protein
MLVDRLKNSQQRSGSQGGEIPRGVVAGRMRGHMMFAQSGLGHVDRWRDQHSSYGDEHCQRDDDPERTLEAHRTIAGEELDALLPG